MKKILYSMLAAAMFLVTAGFVHAEDSQKPVVVVSFSGYDNLLGDINAIGSLSGNPHMGQGVEMLVQLMTQGKGLIGLDKSRPWGAAMLTNGQEFNTFGFLPVTDLKQLIEVAKSNPYLADKIELNDDVYEFDTGGVTIYAKQKGNWVVVSQSPGHLDNAPADPAKLFGELPDKYVLAVRAMIKNLPAQYRQQLLAQLQAVIQVGMSQLPDEDSDARQQMQLMSVKQSLEQIAMLVNESEDFTLGLNIDRRAGTAWLDFELTALDGTKLATQCASFKSDRTRFAGFVLPKAAVTALCNRTLTDADVEQMKKNLVTAREALIEQLEKKELAPEVLQRATHQLDQLIDIWRKNIETKRSEVGMSVLLNSDGVTLVAGASLADDAKLETVLKELVDEVRKDDPAMADAIKLDAETYKGIRFHVFTMPTPEPELEPLVGDKLEIILGLGDHRMLFAAGRDAAKTLKQAIDRSESVGSKDVLPIEISLAASQIAQFIADVTDEEDEEVKDKAKMIAGVLKQAGEKDHITVSVTTVPQGVRLRLELEKGLLKTLGSLSTMGGASPSQFPE